MSVREVFAISATSFSETLPKATLDRSSVSEDDEICEFKDLWKRFPTRTTIFVKSRNPSTKDKIDWAYFCGTR